MSILYADALVSLTDDKLVVQHYYFPAGTAKHIPLSAIQTVHVFPPTLWNGQWRLWGTSGIGIWFACDWARPQRTAIYQLTLKTQGIAVGLTVEDAVRFSACLEAQGLLTRNA
ncbi:MAG: hypothetical protein WCG26_08395 [Chloroflexales bacterium]